MINGPLIFQFNYPKAPNTLFIDRDGVLNEAVLRGLEISSPRSLKEFVISNDIDALIDPDILKSWNFVVVSNQPDLSRELIDLDFLEAINDRINSRIPLNTVYICPHEQLANCYCRKPKIGMVERFHIDYPEIKGRELMIGDRVSDLECASRAEIAFVLRKRHYNKSINEAAGSIIDNLWGLTKLLN